MAGERFTFPNRWHFHVLHQIGDIMYQRAFGAVTRNDIRAIVTTLERRVAIVQPIPAFGLFRTVAANARTLKDRSNVAREINLSDAALATVRQ